jgi:hypothetical protein
LFLDGDRQEIGLCQSFGDAGLFIKGLTAETKLGNAIAIVLSYHFVVERLFVFSVGSKEIVSRAEEFVGHPLSVQCTGTVSVY